MKFFTETKDDFRQLQKAIELCREIGATLLIARVGRLWRSRTFTNILLDAKVEFTGLDDRNVTSETIHIIAELAEEESSKSSRRTKEILQQKKKQGVKLGSARPGHWDGRDRQWGKCVKAASKARTERARDYYASVTPRILEMWAAGSTWAAIAEELNDEGLTMQTGSTYSGISVYRLHQRAKKT